MKDARGHGSNSRGGPAKPIPGHAFHRKSDAELRYIIKDASEAERATRGMSSYNPNSGKREDTAGKYSDQVNDAASVLGYRDRGGKQDTEASLALHSGNPKSDPVPVHDSMAIGDRVHLGFGAKGGAGFFGNLTKIDSNQAEIKHDNGKTYTGSVRNLSKG